MSWFEDFYAGVDAMDAEAVVDYTRLDGRTVSIPVATMIDRRDGLIASQRIYMDVAPLAAPAADPA